MKLIVDANIIFSSLIKDSKTAELLLNFSLEPYSPEFLLEEIEENKQEILEKTKRFDEEFDYILNLIKQIVEIVPKEEFTDNLEQAEQISPDKDDIAYFALALKLNCPIWSNDKKLKEQEVVKVYSTEEIIGILGKD